MVTRSKSLIGNVSFAQMIWLMVRGDLPTPTQAALLECALVAGVDHGPQAPSIAAARMAATCGVGLNNVHGDGRQHAGRRAWRRRRAMRRALSRHRRANLESGADLETATHDGIATWRATYGKIVSGFGHRFHKPVDPRAPRLMALVREAAQAGTVSGRFADIGEAVQAEIGRQRGTGIAMNIDGATAVIFCELGFPPPLSRGLFCLSRSVGVLAHGWEQMQQGGRNKGPMPPKYLPVYEPQENEVGTLKRLEKD